LKNQIRATHYHDGGASVKGFGPVGFGRPELPIDFNDTSPLARGGDRFSHDATLADELIQSRTVRHVHPSLAFIIL
jgi:hypothetical protein